MKPASRGNVDHVERFLQRQRFRHRATHRTYAYVIRGFQRFVLRHAGGAPPTTALVRRWLDDRILQWPLQTVCHHACLVDRFLGWMEDYGAVPTNPFAELRREYGRRTGPIVGALLSEDPDAALQRLRPPPRFGSFLGPLMREHLERMRSVGYLYDSHEQKLLRFDRFLQSHGNLAGAPLRTLLEAWRESSPRLGHSLEVCQAVGRCRRQCTGSTHPLRSCQPAAI